MKLGSLIVLMFFPHVCFYSICLYVLINFSAEMNSPLPLCLRCCTEGVALPDGSDQVLDEGHDRPFAEVEPHSVNEPEQLVGPFQNIFL